MTGTERRAHRTVHFTAARKPTACKYFSAFRRMQLSHIAVVSKAYVEKCREARGIDIWSPVSYSAAPKRVCVKRLAGAGHLSPAVLGTLLSVIPRWTLYRYVPRLRVFHCCCVLAGANKLTVCAVPSLLLKTTGNNTPYPCPAWEATVPSCPTYFKQKRSGHSVHGHALEAISIPSFAAGCWLPMDCSHVVFASNMPFRPFRYKNNNTKYSPPSQYVTPRVYHVYDKKSSYLACV